MQSIADLIALRSPVLGDTRGLDQGVLALGLVGAVNELMIDWFIGGSTGDVDRLVEHCAALFEGALLLANQTEEN
jgi:hypothetical protein